MNKTTIIAECRANPDKIFHLLRENDFARAKELFGNGIRDKQKNGICLHCNGSIKITNPSGYCNHVYWPEHFCEICGVTENYEYHMLRLILVPDVLGYSEQFI